MIDRDVRIRERAYHLWIDEGRPEGREAVHWESARAQIAAEEEAVSAGQMTADPHAAARKPRSGKAKVAAADAPPREALEPSGVKKPRAKQATVTPAKPRAPRKKG